MNNAKYLTRMVLATIACASMSVACSNRNDSVTDRGDVKRSAYDTGTTSGTTSDNTAPTDEGMPSDNAATADTTNGANANAGTESAQPKKSAKAKHSHKAGKKVRKHHKKGKHSSANEIRNEDTVSGTTTAVGENDGAVSSSTIAKQVKYSALNPFYQEPNSRSPVQSGSTSLTGKDKNLAISEGLTPFTDPAVREHLLNTRDAIRPVTDTNFDNYDFKSRADFQSDMRAKLTLLDERIGALKSTIAADRTDPRYWGQVSRLDRKQWELRQQVSRATDVNQTYWSSYRNDFRNKIASLEQDVARLSVAIR